MLVLVGGAAASAGSGAGGDRDGVGVIFVVVVVFCCRRLRLLLLSSSCFLLLMLLSLPLLQQGGEGGAPAIRRQQAAVRGGAAHPDILPGPARAAAAGGHGQLHVRGAPVNSGGSRRRRGAPSWLPFLLPKTSLLSAVVFLFSLEDTRRQRACVCSRCSFTCRCRCRCVSACMLGMCDVDVDVSPGAKGGRARRARASRCSFFCLPRRGYFPLTTKRMRRDPPHCPAPRGTRCFVFLNE